MTQNWFETCHPDWFQSFQIAKWTFLSPYILSLMIWIPYKTNMPTWLPLSSSKGLSLWLLWIVVYKGIPLLRRIWKTPCCNKPHFKGLRLGPRSYKLKTYFKALFLTITKLSLYFLQVYWLWSIVIFKLRPIWSGHPVYISLHLNKNLVRIAKSLNSRFRVSLKNQTLGLSYYWCSIMLEYRLIMV